MKRIAASDLSSYRGTVAMHAQTARADRVSAVPVPKIGGEIEVMPLFQGLAERTGAAAAP
ncbi:MAG: hypothetical protein ACLQOO_26315 [Terriglobia bacterium]